MIEAVDERKCDETATRLGELPEPIGNPNALDRVSDRTWVGMGGESAWRFVEQGRSLIGLALSGDGTKMSRVSAEASASSRNRRQRVKIVEPWASKA